MATVRVIASSPSSPAPLICLSLVSLVPSHGATLLAVVGYLTLLALAVGIPANQYT